MNMLQLIFFPVDGHLSYFIFFFFVMAEMSVLIVLCIVQEFL
jgi:hypothetical protein